jgi:uncharacterized protein (TIGR03118 family)
MTRSTRRLRTFVALVAAMLVAQKSSVAQGFLQTNLVSDISGLAPKFDPQLVNPWGIASSSTSPFWVADNGSGVSTLYNGSGTKQGLVVSIPIGAPTGAVFNASGSYLLSDGTTNPLFLFATQAGTIAAWKGVDGTTATTEAIEGGADYTGLALSGTGLDSKIYAADFAGGRIDVFDNLFELNTGGTFVDPSLPFQYSPFNIQNIGGNLFVSYALKDPITGDEEKGLGDGVVDEYDFSGTFLRRFATGGSLDAPWGFALAPAGFGVFANALMIGNFGNGTIHGYDVTTGDDLGAMEDADGNPIANSGLWGIRFGNGGSGGDVNTLYFSAGINDEKDGLLGSLASVTSTTTSTPEPSSFVLAITGAGALFGIVRRRRGRHAII